MIPARVIGGPLNRRWTDRVPDVGESRLIGDIGGTNARFAIASDGSYRDLVHVEVSRFPSLEAAIRDYLARIPDAQRPRQAALAVAGPVFGDTVTLTNLGWTFSIADLQQRLGLTALRVVNDFAATAMAVPHLPPTDCFVVGPARPATEGPIGIVGPGTGLGVSSLVRSDGKWVLAPGEGGHVTLPAATDEEADIIRHLRRIHGHVSAERALSGAGLVNLYGAVCAVAGKPPLKLTPADVTDHAIARSDAECVAAFRHFCAMLGTVASDLALTIGATGGIYIAGGILLRFKEAFAASGFRERFESKGRFTPMLRSIPTQLILEESPALLGLAHAELGPGS